MLSENTELVDFPILKSLLFEAIIPLLLLSAPNDKAAVVELLSLEIIKP